MPNSLRYGIYDIEFGTWAGTQTAVVQVTESGFHGETSNGSRFQGSYSLNLVRNLISYEAVVDVLPYTQTLTGMDAGENGRAVVIRGEMAPGVEPKRFSLEFAGRAIDISMTYRGPVATDTVPRSRL